MSFTVVLITPFIGSMIFIETTLIWLANSIDDKIKSFIIVFQLINSGYLIAKLFIVVSSLFIKSSLSTDWQTLFRNYNISHNQQMIFILLIAILLLAYLNILARRIKKSLSINIQK